jgi:hypothetical protein
MKFLEPKGRYEPRYEATLDEMFEEIEFIPYNKGVSPRRTGWLFVSETQMSRGYTGGWYYAKFKPDLIEMLAPSIFSNSPENLHEELSAELVRWEAGEIRLYMSFQRIIGSYCMAVLREEDVIAWLDQARKVT